MGQSIYYRISLIGTIVFTVAAFVTLLGWAGSSIRNGLTFPWMPVVLLAVAAANCSFRKRILKK